MNCSKCNHNFNPIFTNGARVEYCEDCGEKLYEDCPYCLKEVIPESFHDTWLRCDLCKLPLLRCARCSTIHSISAVACDHCNEPIEYNISLFSPRNGFINHVHTNTYRYYQADWPVIFPPSANSLIKTGIPLLVNNLLYFWSLQEKNKERWRLCCYDLSEGEDKMAGKETEIQCPHQEKPKIELYGRYLLTSTGKRLWIHDCYDGTVKINHLIVGMPFTAFIDKVSTLVLFKYDNKRGKKQSVSVFPCLDLSDEQIIFPGEVVDNDFNNTDPVLPLELEDEILLAGYDRGLLRIKRTMEADSYIYTCTRTSALNEWRVLQLVNTRGKIFFTCADRATGTLHWGIYADGIVKIRDNISLYLPYIAVYSSGIVFCKINGLTPGIVINELFDNDDDDLPGGTIEHIPANVQELEGFCVLESEDELHCIYTYKNTPPLNYYETASFNPAHTAVTKLGSGFMGIGDSYFVCACNHVIRFINNNGSSTSLQSIDIHKKKS